jgi:hypothetical protein
VARGYLAYAPDSLRHLRLLVGLGSRCHEADNDAFQSEPEHEDHLVATLQNFLHHSTCLGTLELRGEIGPCLRVARKLLASEEAKPALGRLSSFGIPALCSDQRDPQQTPLQLCGSLTSLESLALSHVWPSFSSPPLPIILPRLDSLQRLSLKIERMYSRDDFGSFLSPLASLKRLRALRLEICGENGSE